MMKDDIRPRGTVQVKCSAPGCDWYHWRDALDPKLPDGPFYCPFSPCDPNWDGKPHEKAETP